jgi:molybdenum cofactor synthesis domain-containing protein
MTGHPTPAPARITASILVIGDEILSGRTKDQNIGTIADHLTELGIDLKEVRIVPDEAADIIAAVNAMRGRWTYVFTTGGIGPTHDDITADAIAKAFGVSIDIDPRARALMADYYATRKIELTPARLRMARIPRGATLVKNEVSGAPGFMLGNVIVMAGVPSIMKAMLANATPNLQRGAPIESCTIEIPHPEGEIAELFGAHAQAFPDVAMGSYPQRKDGQLSTQLVLRCADGARLKLAESTLVAQLVAKGLIAPTEDVR